MAASSKNRVVTKRLIPSVLPDMSPEQRAAYDAKAKKEAKDRADAIAAENLIPVEASVTLRFRLCKHGRHWQSYAYDEYRKRWYGLLSAPSLLSSALGVLESEMYRQSVGA